MINPSIRKAVNILKNGGIIAYPTESVFGLGCDPNKRSAIIRILHLKKRNVLKGLILVASSIEQLFPYIKPNQSIAIKLQITMPSPVTWLVPARFGVPLALRGAHDKIAVRITNHPDLVQLCKAWGGPLISTSANPRAQQPARTARKVREYFGGKVDYVLNAKVGSARNPSEIRDSQTDRIIRPA